MVEVVRAASDAPRGPKREAAHASGGTMAKVNRYWGAPAPPKKMIALVAARTTASASASRDRPRAPTGFGENQVRSTGVMSRIPTPSPTHHQTQAPSAWLEGITPPSVMLATPTLALTSGKQAAAVKRP